MTQMNFFITGGSGFIGSNFIKKILENENHQITNLDSLTYAANEHSLNSVKDNPNYNFVLGDISDKDIVNKCFKESQPDIVVNLAAESHVDNSIEDSSNFIKTNIGGTHCLLEASKKYFLEKSKTNFLFHHVSTDEVFGDLPHPDYEGEEALKDLFSEDRPYNPSSPYSASKACSDHLVSAWSRTYGLPSIITNCSNNYGPFQHEEKLIPNMIFKALNNDPLPVYGKGNQIRDWLHVRDHADALYLCATQGKPGEKYNIGGNNEYKNIEVVKGICKILDEHFNRLSDRNNSFEDLISFVDDRPGHDYRYAIDAGKIKRELGWEPKITFEKGLKETVLWYIENQSFYQ